MKVIENKKTFLDRLYAKPAVTIIILAVISLFFALQLPRISIDNNNFNFIPKDDPARIANDKVSEIFGDETPILIGISRKYNSVFELDFVNELRKLESEFLAMPKVNRVVSILNTKHVEGDNGDMISSLLIPDNYTGSDAEIQTVKYKLRDWDEMYNKNLVSDDFKAVQFIIFLSVGSDAAGSPEALAVCRKALDTARNWNFPDSSFYVTGTPVVSEMVNQATAHDLAYLVPIVVLVVILVLYLSFRRLIGVLLPILTVIISVDWALGAMVLFGIKLSILSTVMPVILVAVGSAYGIHVISHYFDEMTQNKTEPTKEEHKQIIIDGMKKIFWPVCLAALTTFAGFISFCFTPVVPILQFGLFSSFGVLVAFIVAILLIPSILILTGPKVFKQRKQKSSSSFDASIARTMLVITSHKRTVLLFLIIAISASAFFSRNIVIDNVLVEYFKSDKIVAEADRFCREKFSGSKELSLIISSDKEDAVIRPDVLLAVDKFTQYFITNYPEVGKITSLSTLIKRLNQVLNSDISPEGLSQVAVNTAANAENDDDFGELGDFSFLDDTGSKDTTDGDNGDEFGALNDFSFLNDVAENDSSESTEPHANASQYTMSFYDFIKYLDETVKEARSVNDLSARELALGIAEKVNYNGLSYYEIPHDPKKYGKTSKTELQAIIHDYLILLASNLDGFVDNPLNPKVQKVTIQLKTQGQLDTALIVDEMQRFIDVNFPKDMSVKIAGVSLIEQSLNRLVVNSQFISLALSLLIVFIILSVYYRSLVAGIIGIIPLLLSILGNFAIMAIFGIKVNIGTALVASFAIGIGIDYTIHYLDAYHREIIANGAANDFLYKTFYGSGKAIIFNALSVGAGFAVLIFSDFRILADLGFLICLVMITSSLASLTVLPVLLNLIKPKFIQKVHKRNTH